MSNPNPYPSLSTLIDFLVANPDGIADDAKAGIQLPCLSTAIPQEYWLENEDLDDIKIHVVKYDIDRLTHMLITDRIAAAKIWRSKSAVVTEKDEKRWSNAFNKDEDDVYPYLNLKIDKTKGYTVTVPRVTSFLDPSKGNIYIHPVNDLREAIDKLVKLLTTGIYRITFLKSDGTKRVMATTYNQDIIKEFYSNDDDLDNDKTDETNLSEMSEEDLADYLAEKQLKADRRLISGTIKVPDLEAPRDDPYRQINIVTIKKIEKIDIEDLDLTFLNFDKQALLNALDFAVGQGALHAGDDIYSMSDEDSMVEPKDGETAHDYAVRVLHGTTAQVKALSNALASFGLDATAWLGEGNEDALGLEEVEF